MDRTVDVCAGAFSIIQIEDEMISHKFSGGRLGGS